MKTTLFVVEFVQGRHIARLVVLSCHHSTLVPGGMGVRKLAIYRHIYCRTTPHTTPHITPHTTLYHTKHQTPNTKHQTPHHTPPQPPHTTSNHPQHNLTMPHHKTSHTTIQKDPFGWEGRVLELILYQSNMSLNVYG